MTGAYVLLIFSACVTGAILFLLHQTQLGHILHDGIPDRPRRRLFLSAVSFFVAFAGVRAVVLCITHHIGPFNFVEMGGEHIHHLVWGILLLVAVGYGFVAEIDHGATPIALFWGRALTIVYGVAAALTLDEFALWLNLKDVYWARQGRESIDAVILFGALLAIGAWGAPLFTGGGGAAKAGKSSQD